MHFLVAADRWRTLASTVLYGRYAGRGFLFLLSYLNVDIDVARNDGRVLSLLAAHRGNVDMARRLLAHGGDIDMDRGEKRGHTAMFVAAKGGYAEIFRRRCVDALFVRFLGIVDCGHIEDAIAK